MTSRDRVGFELNHSLSRTNGARMAWSCLTGEELRTWKRLYQFILPNVPDRIELRTASRFLAGYVRPRVGASENSTTTPRAGPSRMRLPESGTGLILPDPIAPATGSLPLRRR